MHYYQRHGLEALGPALQVAAVALKPPIAWIVNSAAWFICLEATFGIHLHAIVNDPSCCSIIGL